MSDGTRDRLREIAQHAREQRLSGDHHSGDGSEFPLVGYCFDNAYVTYTLLAEAGYDPQLVEGTTERVADELVEAGYDLAEFDCTQDLAGHVHYWVEVNADGCTWVVDIASDTWNRLGECLVEAGRPDEYVVLPNSYEEGSDLIESVRERGDRCQECGGHAHSVGGCSECEGIEVA